MIEAATSNRVDRGADGRLLPGNSTRFGPGNKGGPGNPHAAKVSEFRAALYETVTRDDVVDVVKELVKQARAGEEWAIRELLDRCLGKAEAADLLARVDDIETLIAEAVAGSK